MNPKSTLIVVVGLLVFAYMLGQSLSSDDLRALAYLLFGVLASIPAALLILAATRGPDEHDIYYNPMPRRDRLRVEGEQQERITEKELRLTAEAAYWRGVAAGQQERMQGRSGAQNRSQGQLPRRG